MVELGEEFSAGDRLLDLEVDGALPILSPAAGKSPKSGSRKRSGQSGHPVAVRGE